MATALKRSISLLLVLVLALGVIPIAFAAETETTDSTGPTENTTVPTEETVPLETTESTEPPDTTAATEETTAPTEITEPPVMFVTNSGIATIAEAEINGAPNAFANLTLPSGGIDIPAQGYMQHKTVLPLYSLYLKNVDYLLDAPQARSMLSNSEFIVMLNQAEKDQERLSQLLNISPEQMRYVNGSEAGSGLLRYGNALVPFVNKFPMDTELYRLITTRPGEGVFAKGQVDFDA